MCIHAGPLDAIVAHEIARRTHAGCGCACERCGRRRGGGALRLAQTRHAATGFSSQQVSPVWGGWSPAVTLGDINRAQRAATAGQTVDAALRPFLAKGHPQIYRISRAGIDRDRPLSIGITGAGRSVGRRLWEHFRQPSRGDKTVHAAIRNLLPSQILVQVGRLSGTLSSRRAHTYNIGLQNRERPLVSDPANTALNDS
jgi:hypothetical protein